MGRRTRAEREEFATARWVRREVAKAKPLTARQRERIGAILARALEQRDAREY